jgi:malonyl CoA-acyl carrier protein transacylase
MADAARGAARGGMLALLGPGAREFVQRHADQAVTLANDNGPEQVVVAGRDDALAHFELVAVAAGYRVRRLPLEFAAHSPFMADVARRFARELRRYRFRPPAVAVWSCSTAAPFDDIPRRLAEGVARPVLWRELLHRLHGEGARTFLETGPGRVLTKLARTTLDGIEASSVASARARGVPLEQS